MSPEIQEWLHKSRYRIKYSSLLTRPIANALQLDVARVVLGFFGQICAETASLSFWSKFRHRH